MNGLREALSGNVRAELARRQIGAAEVAELLGRSRAQLARRMNGEVPWSAEDLVTLAEAYDIPALLDVPEDAS